jgi:phosphoribosylaminoimidazolecarboxamide formyltransferase/IMP cyclohydrolase
MSFNNVADLDAGLELIAEFDRPAAVVVKHANPCGAAVAEDLRAAYEKAYLGDPGSAYGGVVVLNRPLDVATARALAELRGEEDGARLPYFVEVLAAPDLEPEALELLRDRVGWAGRIRILRCGPFERAAVDAAAQDFRRVTGGILVQDRDLVGFEPDALTVAGRHAPTEGQVADLAFAWLCCKHARSNAAVVAADGALVGLGAGQVSRVGAVGIAVSKAGQRAEGAVLASDGFLPFADNVERAAEAGVRAIIQPGGSKKDAEVIAAADGLGLAMVLTGTRHFRH